MHKINYLLDLWEKRFEGLIADGKRSPTSLDTWRNITTAAPRFAQYQVKTDRELPIILLTRRTT